MSLGELISIVVTGLVVGALARLALAGLIGALVGSVLAAALLLLAYRRFVQKRPITGPEAQLPPRSR